MTIGLTAEQLLQNFSESLKQRKLAMTAEMLTAEVGINPPMDNFLSEIKKEMPNIPTSLSVSILNILLAFMDTIVSNNKELAKLIPHLEP